MKKTYTILLLLVSVLVQGQTITSENKLIQQGTGFYDPQGGGFRNEDFPLNLELFRSQTRLWRLKNSTGKTLSIIIDFEKLIGATATERLPYIKTVGPGVHTLFELKSTGTTTFDYSYLFYYTESILVTQPADFDYLLPVDESEEVTLISYNYDADEPYVSPIKYADGVSQFYGLEFKPENSKNITAIRGGVVEFAESTLPESRLKNRIRIRHADGTVADYLGFANQGLMVKEGDVVLPGQKIGELDYENRLFISLSYQTVTVDRLKPHNDWLKTVFFRPTFQTNRLKGQLKIGYTYISNHSEDLVTQEMSKKERKRFLAESN